jgi:hypothetical protein
LLLEPVFINWSMGERIMDHFRTPALQFVQEEHQNTDMAGIKQRAGIALFLILAALPPQGLAKCPTLTAEVHGRLQCTFKPDYKILVTLIFRKNQAEASAEETALDIHGNSFRGRIGFNSFTSYHPVTGNHQCNRRPTSILVRFVTAAGEEWDRRVLRVPDDFAYDEKLEGVKRTV